MNTLDEWAAAVCGELGLDPAALDPRLVLDLARDVAHGVARPAAPLTAYLLGVAARRVGRADQPAGRAMGPGREATRRGDPGRGDPGGGGAPRMIHQSAR